jgi:hypothetical protein
MLHFVNRKCDLTKETMIVPVMSVELHFCALVRVFRSGRGKLP